MQILEVYTGFVARCPTINQLNSVHIALDATITPLEIAELHAQLVDSSTYWDEARHGNTRVDPQRLRNTSCDWVKGRQLMCNMSLKRRPEPFHREEMLPTITRFSNAEGPHGKWLVVVVCGNTFTPMVPTPAFLQALDARRVDMVLMRDFNRQGFRQGVGGISDDILSSMERLPRILDFAAYDAVSFVGISGGGMPSLIFGIGTGARSVVYVGGNAPTDPRWNASDGTNARDLLLELAEGKAVPQIKLIFGRESKDRPAAEAIAALFPATLVEVTDEQLDVGHNSLHPLLLRGRLSAFLNKQIGLTD